MILHTIISEDDIFYSPYEGDKSGDFETRRIKGGFAQIKKHGGEYKAERIFSTDPSVYLNILDGHYKI